MFDEGFSQMTSEQYGLRACVTNDLVRFCMLTKQRNVSKLGFTDWLSIFSPRFQPMLLHRIAYKLQISNLGPLAKLFSLINFVLFGIEIATRCPIGGGLFFAHTQGTVIGAVSIGRNATIYQGVTIGAKEMDFAYIPHNRPTIADEVMIGAGAKVLGGITIQNRVKIGANTVVTSDVAEGQTVVGSPMRVIGKSENGAGPTDELE